MKLYEEFKLYENMWSSLSESDEDTRNKYIDVMLSIYNRNDFIEKAQEIYDNMPISAGFRISYSKDGENRFTGIYKIHKLADGSLEAKGPGQSTTIIDPKNAVSVLKTIAGVEGSTIWTSRRHDPEHNHNDRFRFGYRVVLPNGEGGIPTYNNILP